MKRVQPLGRADPLEEEMATGSNILARKIPRTEEPTIHRIIESDMTQPLSTHIRIQYRRITFVTADKFHAAVSTSRLIPSLF